MRKRTPRPDLRLVETVGGVLCTAITIVGWSWLCARFRLPSGTCFRKKFLLDWDTEAVLRHEARREGVRLAG